MTESELIARAKAGDQGAFEQLVLDNQNRVYSLALRMLGDPEDAQDAAQEAFLNAWRALPTFKWGSSFPTWVYRLTSNACIDHLRRRKRRRDLEVASLTGEDGESDWEPADHQADPALQTERRMAKEAVEAGLQALPDHQREILVMRELSGPVLPGDRSGAGPGPGHGEIPHRPRPAGTEKNFDCGRELFCLRHVYPKRRNETEVMAVISCERAWELLSQQLDEPLSPQEKQELEEHLAACPSCRKDKEELELLDQALRNLGEIQAPADFTQRVMAQMQQQTQSKPKVIPLWRRPQVRALAGLAACALLCIGIYRPCLKMGI